MSGSEPGPEATVDTNLFISGAINPTGAPGRLLRAWIDGRCHLVLSADQLAELTEVFQRPKLARRFRIEPADLAEVRATRALVPRARPAPSLPVPVRDPKDAMVVAAALGGAADYLVTGDDDLLVLAGDPHLGRLLIVTIHEFLAVLGSSRREIG